MITQKKYLNLIGLLVALITGVLFLPGLSHAVVTVEGEYDFGEVEVGTPASATLKISSTELRVYITELTLEKLEKDCGFSISPEVPPAIPLPGDIIINYVPLSPGDCQSTLSIVTNFGDTAKVTLSGTGVITTQEITIEGILVFFDTCVADGSLIGYVPDKSDKKRSADKITKGNESDKLAENRLNALRNMIETAGVLIDSGKIDEACGQLEAAYKKMDGLNTPGSSSDFVEGSAVSLLAHDVQTLMGTLECK
jgi:hypothetical protein